MTSCRRGYVAVEHDVDRIMVDAVDCMGKLSPYFDTSGIFHFLKIYIISYDLKIWYCHTSINIFYVYFDPLKLSSWRPGEGPECPRARRHDGRSENLGKCCSFSALSAPILASKYAFFSIFQNLPDYQAEILEIYQNFAIIILRHLQIVCWI